MICHFKIYTPKLTPEKQTFQFNKYQFPSKLSKMDHMIKLKKKSIIYLAKESTNYLD